MFCIIKCTNTFYLQILERKNNEIEELKILYKKKQSETEETIRKLEKKGDVMLLCKFFNNICILFFGDGEK